MLRESIQAMVTATALGALSEALAYAMNLWVYRSPAYTAFNIVFVFGIVMGGLAVLIPRRGVALSCAGAAGVGFLYELANFRFLGWWSFPGGRFLSLAGEFPISLALALLWGAVPLAVSILRPPGR